MDRATGGIFICYRRGDDPGFTHALYHILESEFTAAKLFMDVEGHIKPGDDFVEVINARVAACEVLLAVIGPRWVSLMSVADEHHDDFVVIEILAALDQGKRVIPVLVGSAEMPRADQLPAPIKRLWRRNAVTLRQERFSADCQGLMLSLKNLLDDMTMAQAADVAIKVHKARPARKTRKATTRSRKPTQSNPKDINTDNTARKKPDADSAARKKPKGEKAVQDKPSSDKLSVQQRHADPTSPKERVVRKVTSKTQQAVIKVGGEVRQPPDAKGAAINTRKSKEVGRKQSRPAVVSTKPSEKNESRQQPDTTEAELLAADSDAVLSQKATNGAETERLSREFKELSSWSLVDGQGDVALVRDHLARFPGGVTEDIALTYLEYLIWMSLGSELTAPQLESFIREFPHGSMVDIARNKLVARGTVTQKILQQNYQYKNIISILQSKYLSNFISLFSILQNQNTRLYLYSISLSIIFIFSNSFSYVITKYNIFFITPLRIFETTYQIIVI